MLYPVFQTDPPILHATCASGDPRAVKKLLDEGEDPLAFDKLGLSPLHYACSLRPNVRLFNPFRLKFSF